MKIIENIPKVRFKGFNNDWKCTTLGEVTNRIKSYSLSREVETSDNSGIKYVHYGDIHTGKADIITKGNFLPYIHDSKKFTEYLKKDDLVFADASEDYKGIASVAVIAEKLDERLIAGLHTIAVRPVENLNSEFLYYQLKNQTFRKHGYKVGTGMKVFGISPSNLFKFAFTYPSLAEQSQIGALFSTIDSLLSSYKDNLENYQSFKKSMLSKMFPKGGQTMPEIRLDGYEGDWTFVPLNDIAEKVKEKNKNNFYSETLTNSAEFGIINQREFFDKDISNEKNLDAYYVVQNDDFIYNPRISKFAPVGPIKRNKLGRTGVMSPLYFVFRVQDVKAVNLDYLETVFSNSLWHKFMKLNGDSGARSDRFSIKDSVFITMPIPLPSIAEQQAIGSFFSNLDNLISSYQTKINELETLKKKLLQDMFI